jgi:hypothetical protein
MNACTAISDKQQLQRLTAARDCKANAASECSHIHTCTRITVLRFQQPVAYMPPTNTQPALQQAPA